MTSHLVDYDNFLDDCIKLICHVDVYQFLNLKEHDIVAICALPLPIPQPMGL